MVNHQDAVVYDDAERHGDAGKGVDMDMQAAEIIKRHGHQQVDGKCNGNYHHIPPGPVDRKREEQQDQKAEDGPEEDFIKLCRDIFRIIIAH